MAQSAHKLSLDFSKTGTYFSYFHEMNDDLIKGTGITYVGTLAKGLLWHSAICLTF